MAKVAIVGSRGWRDPTRIRLYIQSLPHNTVIVSGGACGVDRMAAAAAEMLGMETEIYPAEWKLYGKSAGYKRNATIVKNADRIVAFWDGKSRGTEHTIDLAIAAGKKVTVFRG